MFLSSTLAARCVSNLFLENVATNGGRSKSLSSWSSLCASPSSRAATFLAGVQLMRLRAPVPIPLAGKSYEPNVRWCGLQFARVVFLYALALAPTHDLKRKIIDWLFESVRVIRRHGKCVRTIVHGVNCLEYLPARPFPDRWVFFLWQCITRSSRWCYS